MEAMNTPLGRHSRPPEVHTTETVKAAKKAVEEQRRLRRQQRAERQAARMKQAAEEIASRPVGMLALRAPEMQDAGQFLIAGADTFSSVVQCVTALGPLVSCLAGMAPAGLVSQALGRLVQEMYHTAPSCDGHAQVVSLQPLCKAVLQALPQLAAHTYRGSHVEAGEVASILCTAVRDEAVLQAMEEAQGGDPCSEAATMSRLLCGEMRVTMRDSAGSQQGDTSYDFFTAISVPLGDPLHRMVRSSAGTTPGSPHTVSSLPGRCGSPSFLLTLFQLRNILGHR